MAQCNAIAVSRNSQCKLMGCVMLKDNNYYCSRHVSKVEGKFFCECCHKYVSLPGNWAYPFTQDCGHVFCNNCLRKRLDKGDTSCPECAAGWDIEYMSYNLSTYGELLAKSYND